MSDHIDSFRPVPYRRRSLLLQGFVLLWRRSGGLWWTYALNLGLALLFSIGPHARISSVLSHSLAAERLNSAFDLGVLLQVGQRLSDNAPSSGGSEYLGLPLYLLGYFLLVPGTLRCFRVDLRGRLSTLLSNGLQLFWRFVRISLLTLLASALLLGPLFAAQTIWARHLDQAATGSTVLRQELPGLLLIAAVAALLRLYFDLVEVYVVALGEQDGPDGTPERRVRRALLPAFRALRRNFFRSYGTFLFLALLGAAAFFTTGRLAVLTLAQPRVWPAFLLAQAGLFAMLATRFWQRAAETILCSDNPLPAPARPVEAPPAPLPIHLQAAAPQSARQSAQQSDPQSDPEPAVPSLDAPDPGVFHHSETRDQ